MRQKRKKVAKPKKQSSLFGPGPDPGALAEIKKELEEILSLLK